MGFFSFIESFFFLSLGITFVLIFLMVFHFKQRVEQLEKKSENMLEVCNGLVQQINGLKTFCISNQTGSSFLPPSSGSSRISENITFSTSSPIPIPEENITTNSFQKIVVEDFDDSDEEEEEEEDEEDEDIDVSDELDSAPVSSLPLDSSSEELFSGLQSTIIEDFVLKEGIEEVDMNLLEEENVLDSLPIELQQEEEIQVQPEKEEEEIKLEEEENKSEEEVDIKNLSLQQLRQLVSNKGLSTNPNKMKKQELVQLLQKPSTESKTLQDLALLL
jgi:hypothetical protein